MRKHKRPVIHAAGFRFGVEGKSGGRGGVCRPDLVFYWNEKTTDPARVTCKTCLRLLPHRGVVL